MNGSICFFGLDNYRMLRPDPERPVSGEAVQQVLLARAFRSLGYRVSMIVMNSGPERDQIVEGIRVLRAFNWEDGLPVLRFVHPRNSGAFRALHDADADVYYQSPAGMLTGVTAAYCRLKDRRFVFRVASDANCVPGGQLIDFWRDRKLYEYGLRRADLVAVQTKRQQEMLRHNYGLDSEIVGMVMDLPQQPPDSERDVDVLWVGNLRPVKRAELVLDAAAKLPGYRFVMIGGVLPRAEAYYEQTATAAARLPNVSFMGQLPYDDVNAYMARSKVLLNTSTVEGFPNTFLQAWAREVPVVSFFDPDDTIGTEGLGVRPRTEDDLVGCLRSLLEDDVRRTCLGKAGRAYAVSRFSPEAAARRYIELI